MTDARNKQSLSRTSEREKETKEGTKKQKVLQALSKLISYAAFCNTFIPQIFEIPVRFS